MDQLAHARPASLPVGAGQQSAPVGFPSSERPSRAGRERRDAHWPPPRRDPGAAQSALTSRRTTMHLDLDNATSLELELGSEWAPPEFALKQRRRLGGCRVTYTTPAGLPGDAPTRRSTPDRRVCLQSRLRSTRISPSHSCRRRSHGPRERGDLSRERRTSLRERVEESGVDEHASLKAVQHPRTHLQARSSSRWAR